METTITQQLQTEVEDRLAEREPDVEVLLAEVTGGGVLRVFIDHPDGVTIGTCERVTLALGDLRERYAVEVSSPGRQRPLTKPAHFARFTGRRARVKTVEPLVEGEDSEPRASFRGEIVAADDRQVTVATTGGIVAIPYGQIRRANLIED
ncbi:MAG TPA: ribosome maturation factor RimP [Solirubrobacteraceae bacterium]|nr:ribosome maturation factor RimP [Solirubrobacteraceae bacterium]